MEILFPVFVRAKDDGEVSRFGSVEAMQRELEAIDVENREYEAWDRTGLPLDLKVQNPLWLKLEPPPRAANPDQLNEAILGFAARRGIRIEVDSAAGADSDSLFLRVTSEIAKTKGSKGPLKKLLERTKQRWRKG